MMNRILLLACLIVFVAVATDAKSDLTPLPEFSIDFSTEFPARDTLDPSQIPATPDQESCLNGLAWEPAQFSVQLEKPNRKEADFLLRFPSPLPSQHEVNNRVALEAYLARDAHGNILKRPAVVVVHESGRRMPVGRMFTRSFHRQGYHAFLLHLPGYGARNWGERPTAPELLPLLKQGITDVRRARDAVASLPIVEPNQIFLQGTSLGGIVSATTSGIDQGYAGTFLMLAGGDLASILKDGKKDAARMREQMEMASVSPEALYEMINAIEPLRLASRINPQRAWLYSGKYDDVIPMKNADALVEAAKLPKSNHIIMSADHYSGVLYFPAVMKHMDEQIQQIVKSQAKSSNHDAE